MGTEPQAGDIFAGLLLEEEIGRGGMGVVFRARDVALDSLRAVKVIAGEYSSDEVYAARFRREARIASSLEHPNLVPVYGAGEEDGRLYLVMRLITGTDLASALATGPLPEQRAIALLRDVAAGLDAAHAAGLVHRDVKPANILIEPRSFGERAYLTDFGIAKVVGLEPEGATAATGLTRGGQVLGTADYVAPEQVEDGSADSRSDVYSLACVAFEVLTGAAPFRRDSDLSTLIAHTKAPRPSASELDPSLPARVDAVLREGMAIDPAVRPGSTTAFVDLLDAAARDGRDRRHAPSARRARRSLAWPAWLLALVALAVLAWQLADRSGEGEPGSTIAPGGGAVGASRPEVSTGRVGAGPVGIAMGGLRLWVASRDADRVDSLQPESLRPYADPVPLPAPRSVAAGFGSIWAVNGEALYRLDPGEGWEPLMIPVTGGPDDVAVDDRYVWVSDEDDDSVSRIDPGSNRLSGTVGVGTEPRSIATGGGAVWVVSSGDASLAKIDPSTVAIEGSPVAAGIRPTSVAFGSGRAWVADNAGSKLVGFDPGRDGEGPGEVEVRARTSASPRGLAVGLGAVWVASGAQDRVDRFDPGTGERIGRPIEVGGNPADIAIGSDAAYAANFDDATVSRIEP